MLSPLFVLLFGCTTPETSPGPTGAVDAPSLQVTLTTPGFRAATGLALTRLDVWVAEIVFDADTTRRSLSVTEPVQTQVDVLTGVATPDVLGIDLEPACYGSPYVGVELWDEGPEPALTLEGALDGVPIRLVFNSGEVFETEAESLEIPGTPPQAVTFTLDPDPWFRNVNAATLQVGADGVAEISEVSNAGVFDRVADALDATTDGRFPTGTRCNKSASKTTDTGL